jgi:hypothetical protein
MNGRCPQAGLVGLAIALAATAVAAQIVSGVSMKVSKETAPPGGMAQMKVYITEPKPISTGLGRFSFGAYAGIDGIALMSPGNDTVGVAVVNGTEMALSLVSPSATFGTDPEYPVLAVAGRIPVGTPIGIKFPLDFRPGTLSLRDASGIAYPTEIKPGHLVTAPGLSIHDVRPGSADLPAGAVVTILGSEFGPRTEVRFDEVKLAQVRYVDSGRIDVVLAQPAHMHGMAIKATNPDGSRSAYFSYQRTTRAGPSGHSVFANVVPVFPYRTTLAAAVTVAGAETGLALQNLETTDTTVVTELMLADGLRRVAVLNVPSNQFVVKELSEIFGPYVDAATVCIHAVTPVQVMGVALDAGNATPIVAAETAPGGCN